VQRTLGRSGIAVGALGLGTARIGGLGYSRRGDCETALVPSAVQESKRAIRAAIDRGVTFFDKADVYGAGRSECLLGEALRGLRRKVVIATEFGEWFDEETGEARQGEITPECVAQACEKQSPPPWDRCHRSPPLPPARLPTRPSRGDPRRAGSPRRSGEDLLLWMEHR